MVVLRNVASVFPVSHYLPSHIAGHTRELEHRKDSLMDRITQTLATVINVLFVAGVFGAMTVALGTTIA